MKLKYYLRGVGIGIIFATLVMTVSSLVHKNNISDDYIIKEARKLGMVMKEEVDEGNGLWGGNDTEDAVLESETTEDTQGAENSQVAETESESESQEETPVVPETPVEPEVPVEPEAPVVPETPVEPEQPTVNVDENTVTIEVVSGDTPRKVGEKLAQAGEDVDPEAFMKYVGEHGYAKKLRKGTYTIPKGATFEEICKILFG